MGLHPTTLLGATQCVALFSFLPSFAWAPMFAEVAVDGSLGFTYGDWNTRDVSTDSVTSRGRYLTVWKKQDGEWKVMADIGNDAR